MNLLPDSPINTPYVEIHSHDTPSRDSESSRLLNVQMTYGFKSDAGYRPAVYQTFDSASTQINSTTDNIKIHNHNHNYSSSSITTESNQPSPAYSPICNKTYDILPSETSENDKYYNYSDNNPVEINSSTNYELPISNTDEEKNLNNHSSSCESNNYDYNEIYSPDILNDDEKKLLSLDSIEIKSIINSNSSDNSIATSIKSDDDIDNELSGCDIEQCLMQIEESLLNIEQNLLHVQNLEIPQLNNLLNNRFIINNHNSNNDNHKKKLNGLNYKRPCSENSKYNYNNYYLDNKLLINNYIRLSHSDSDIDIEKNIYFNSPKRDCLDNNDSTYSKYSSLLKKSQTLIEDNFKKIQLLNEIKSDFINFNSCNNDNNLGKSVKLINDKNLFNSFDNNYDYDDDDYLDTNKKRINSLSNYFLKSSVSSSSSINCRKTSSQGAIEKYRRDNEFKVRKKKLKVCRSINISSDGLFDDINCKKSDKLRKKFKTIATTKDIMMSFKKLKVSDNGSKSRNFVIKDIDDNLREESKGDDDKKKLIDNNKCANKNKSLQSHDNNALVPSKLLSLSFSLLLAALLQAVRCLADIVEDTFRSVTFDKYALHE